jgi:glycosyltransferase involved in cell wall biosynthesis
MVADAFKLPAIVSNVGAFSEYIDEGENGSIYDVENEDELSVAIISFLKNKPTFKSKNDLNSKMNCLKLVDLYSTIASKNKK